MAPTTTVSFRLGSDEVRMLQTAAEAEGLTASDVLRSIVGPMLVQRVARHAVNRGLMPAA